RGGAKKDSGSLTLTQQKEQLRELRKRWEVKHNEHMRKHGFERGFIDCRTLKEQGIERRPEVHLGFEAAGRLDDAQRHDIMQKRSEPDYSRHLEQARTVGHDIREWLDTPVKQHELVRRLQHDVAREYGFDMRDRVSRQNRTAPERVKSPSRGFSMGF
ncbi:MobA/MobL family protein, partial [Shigella flexneri]|nr:MobA/MobL family protein [Shigella flexneri]